MFTLSLSPLVMRRSLALAAFTAAASLAASSQTAQTTTASEPAAATSVQGKPALGSVFQPVQPWSVRSSFLSGTPDGQEAGSSSSSSYDAQEAAQTQLASVEQFQVPGVNAFQYGQRRRYGAPRYRGGNTNPDGSEKYTFYAGGGFASPVGDNSSYLTTGWGIQAGAGRNLNRHFGVNVEFDYDHFGLTDQTIIDQSVRYFNDPANQNGLGGNSHIWSFNLQPVYQIYSGPGLGAYITGGVGFYHKVANFTLPQEEQYCDYFYGCYGFYANENVDHYTSNAPGFDGGIGLTYKFSRFSNERLYAEARYVYINNQFKPGDTNATSGSYTGNNYFPENSNTTSYFPIKFGIRF